MSVLFLNVIYVWHPDLPSNEREQSLIHVEQGNVMDVLSEVIAYTLTCRTDHNFLHHDWNLSVW